MKKKKLEKILLQVYKLFQKEEEEVDISYGNYSGETFVQIQLNSSKKVKK